MSLEQGLISHYWLDKNSIDNVGGNNGVDTDITYSDRSAVFNGTSSYIVSTNNIEIHGNSNRVFSAWITYTVGAEIILFSGKTSTNEAFGISIDATTHKAKCFSWGADVNGTTVLVDGNIYNIVGSYDGTSMKLYVNSIEEGSLTASLNTEDEKLYFSGNDTHGLMFKGTISNVRIYNESKDQTFIDELYAEDAYKPFTQERVDTSNNEIEAIGTDGYAISKPIVQEAEQGDFVSVKNISGDFEFANISESTVAESYSFNDTFESNKGNTLIPHGSTSFIDIEGKRGCKVENGYFEVIPLLETYGVIDISISCSLDSIGSEYPEYINSIFGMSNGSTRGITLVFDNQIESYTEMTIGLLDRGNIGTGNIVAVNNIITIGKLYDIRYVQNTVDKTIKVYLDGTVIIDTTYTVNITYFDLNIGREVSNTAYYANITYENLQVTSQNTNTFITSEKIKDGDNLVIVKDDDSIHELVASGVKEYLYDWKTIGTTITLSENKKNAFSLTNDDHANSQVYSDLMSKSFSVDFLLEGNTNVVGISTINTKQDSYFASVSAGYGYNTDQAGSGGIYNNGLYENEYGTSGTNIGDTLTVHYSYITGILGFSLNGTYLGDAFTLPSETNVYLAATLKYSGLGITILNEDFYQMDTTSITQGEIPSKAYRVDESVSLNGTSVIENGNTYSGIDPLLSTRTFSEIDISGREIVTQVNMGATGNRMKSLDFEPFRSSIGVTLTNIIEDTTGSCNWSDGETCQATSVYSAVGTGIVTYEWVASGGIADTGSESTFTVASTGNTDTAFDIELTVIGESGSETIIKSFTHTRQNVNDEFDMELLYDVNNIAQEFV